MNEVKSFLKENNISYEIVEHPAAYTTELADKYIEGKDGVRSKTMFMAGKKDRKFYLLILDEIKRLDLKSLSELVGDRLHFASEEQLEEKLGLKPGIVSLFGLINDKNHEVNVYIDKDLLDEEIITFHPNDNTATVFISFNDMFLVLDILNYDYKIIEM